MRFKINLPDPCWISFGGERRGRPGEPLGQAGWAIVAVVVLFIVIAAAIGGNKPSKAVVGTPTTIDQLYASPERRFPPLTVAATHVAPATRSTSSRAATVRPKPAAPPVTDPPVTAPAVTETPVVTEPPGTGPAAGQYRAGEFCSSSYAMQTTKASNGSRITCEPDGGRYRWKDG